MRNTRAKSASRRGSSLMTTNPSFRFHSPNTDLVQRNSNMEGPGTIYSETRGTSLQARFVKLRKEFQQIFNKQLANLWDGPQAGFSEMKFRKAIGVPADAATDYFIHSKYGDRALVIYNELMDRKSPVPAAPPKGE